MFGRKYESHHKRADAALNTALHLLISAKEAAETAVTHTVNAIESHQAAIDFHRERHADAVTVNAEADGVLADITRALG